MVGLLGLRARGQSDVTCAERRGVFGDLRVSRFLQCREEESQCEWCEVSSFASLSLSLSLSLGWSSGLWTAVCFHLIRPRCREICLLYRFSLLIRSSWVFFFRDGHGLSEKLLLIIFYFWQISSTFRYALILCAETPFSILKKVSAPITPGECSRWRLLQSLFCVYDRLEEISFGHIIYV